MVYAKSESPFGPFNNERVILRGNDTVGNGAGHHSVLQIPGTDDWYIAYHRRPVGDKHRDHRVTCIDRMYFDLETDEILPVVITAEGVEPRPVS